MCTLVIFANVKMLTLLKHFNLHHCCTEWQVGPTCSW
jgi:hypothetical protein